MKDITLSKEGLVELNTHLASELAKADTQLRKINRPVAYTGRKFGSLFSVTTITTSYNKMGLPYHKYSSIRVGNLDVAGEIFKASAKGIKTGDFVAVELSERVGKGQWVVLVKQ